jgi:SOS-response transcriptional repressor LexA
MPFARADDHLDHDEIASTDLFVPRPDVSYRFYVTDNRLAAYGILPGDLAIIERGHALRAGRFALVSIDGRSRLVRVIRDGSKLSFEDFPPHAVTIEVIGTATRILRVFLP